VNFEVLAVAASASKANVIPLSNPKQAGPAFTMILT